METTLVARDLAAVERRLRSDAAEAVSLIASEHLDAKAAEAVQFAAHQMKRAAAELEVIRRSL